MELEFCSVEQWLAAADRQIPCDIAPYQVQDAAGNVIRIVPFISDCAGLIVLGRDWIPVRDSGVALLEQMVHTPDIFLPKAVNVRTREGKYFADIKTLIDCPDDALLIGGSPNYYHWLIDNLPRLLLARKCCDIGALRIVVNKPLLRFQRESLALLGITDAQLLAVANEEVIRPRRTTVPSMLAAATVVHPAVPALLQAAFPRRNKSTCARVYLSRQDATTRQLTNEAELTELLERFGFERYVPAELGFQEQIDLCYGAEALVAVHGAAMTSLVFCPPAAQVFEIFTPQNQLTFMYMLSRLSKRKHHFVPARNVTYGADGNPMNGSWAVDLAAMESALNMALD
ncbi:MAG: glycosyltransferase 61 family protein [Betaproteobacteria bacterium]